MRNDNEIVYFGHTIPKEIYEDYENMEKLKKEIKEALDNSSELDNEKKAALNTLLDSMSKHLKDMEPRLCPRSRN